ncbi:MAG: SEC-C metal-binding domain-containing protein, partial [Candidatus Electrothrix sp.]
MKPSRNQPCYCGSGLKYKKCCLRKDAEKNIGKILSKKKVAPNDINILKEISHIMDCAKKGDSRLVSFASFILFSTDMGDAWLLEQRENLALCLMEDGQEQPYIIEDTPQRFFVGWNSSYRIDGDRFMVN